MVKLMHVLMVQSLYNKAQFYNSLLYKGIFHSVTQDAIEECRKLCGGHGYLNSSGLPELFAVYVPACTYEGDNIVLLLQVCMLLIFLSCDDVNHLSCFQHVVYLIEALFFFHCVFCHSLWWYLQVARILMKTVSQLASGKQPVGTMAYMGKVQYLMQCKSAVNSGT